MPWLPPGPEAVAPRPSNPPLRLRFLAGRFYYQPSAERGEKVTAGYRIRPGRWRLGRWHMTGAAVAAILLTAGCGTAGYGAPVAPTQMTVKSVAFISGTLGQRYTCSGAKINPPLNWSSAPPGTKSLALIVDDSSAPITPFIYWLVFDINPGSTDIQEDSLPTGARQAMNSADSASYDPPCPGAHRHSYRFTVYALNRTLAFPNGAPLQTVWRAIAAATIGRGRIVVSTSP
jgi:Raf kinase inhibitor-like YbhB/YbcL family protein